MTKRNNNSSIIIVVGNIVNSVYYVSLIYILDINWPHLLLIKCRKIGKNEDYQVSGCVKQVLLGICVLLS